MRNKAVEVEVEGRRIDCFELNCRGQRTACGLRRRLCKMRTFTNQVTFDFRIGQEVEVKALFEPWLKPWAFAESALAEAAEGVYTCGVPHDGPKVRGKRFDICIVGR